MSRQQHIIDVLLLIAFFTHYSLDGEFILQIAKGSEKDQDSFVTYHRYTLQ